LLDAVFEGEHPAIPVAAATIPALAAPFRKFLRERSIISPLLLFPLNDSAY